MNLAKIQASSFLHELLLSTLFKKITVDADAMGEQPFFFTIQQLIQYRVIEDSIGASKFLLEKSRGIISKTESHKLWQCGMDMMKRVGADEEIIEAFLKNGKVNPPPPP